MLAFDEVEWQKITAFFEKIQRPLTPNNRKQAMVPTIGEKVINNWGTAPGAWFAQDGKYAVLMPGVPREMKSMWEEGVKPKLLAMQNACLTSKTLRVIGGESWLEYSVRDLLESENPTAAIYCKTGECEIRITARAESAEKGEKLCAEYAKKFYDVLGQAVYDVDVPGIETTLVRLLSAQGKTAATAESCTGGLVAQRITDVAGASAVFEAGYVTYASAQKTKMLGVSPRVIAQYNVVSAPVAAQMAVGALHAAGADYAVSTTGLAGPGGGDDIRPVGTIYLAVASKESDSVWVGRLVVGNANRTGIRQRASHAALAFLLRKAQGLSTDSLGLSSVYALAKGDIMGDISDALQGMDDHFVHP